MGSDVDLVLLADDVEDHLESLDFVSAITPRGMVVRSEAVGPLHEHRVRMPGGLLGEFGIAAPGWIEQPVDPGTRRVVSDERKILYDQGLVSAALESLDLAVRQWTPGG